jgi:hypothetical protein
MPLPNNNKIAVPIHSERKIMILTLVEKFAAQKKL